MGEIQMLLDRLAVSHQFSGEASEWLLPLRVLVSGIQSENAHDYDDFATSISCALNLLVPALYHCLELVEEQLKHPA